jgi:pimeloyl-ACP methyl ester carboxylesterase
LALHVRHTYATVNGVRLHCAEAGPAEGPLVILLHGFPEFWYGWRHQIPTLAAAGLHVVAPDMRGYNLSSKPRGVRAYRLDVLCADVKQLIEHFGVERAGVVGHDWGALVAWSFAMAYPERLERLAILNAPHPLRTLAALRTPSQLRKSWYIFFFQLPWLPEALLRAADYAALRRVFATDPLRHDAFSAEDIERYVAACAEPGALTGGINYYRASMRNGLARYRASVRRIEAPVLVLWGDRDRYINKQLAEPPAEWVPHAAVEHFPDSSHWVQHDKAEAVSQQLVSFLGGPRVK